MKGTLAVEAIKAGEFSTCLMIANVFIEMILISGSAGFTRSARHSDLGTNRLRDQILL